MLDPESTKVLPRRILASVIDLLILGILGGLVLWKTAIVYSNVGRYDNGNLAFTASQEAELRGLSFQQLVRVQEFGDTVVIFGGSKFWFGLLFTLLLAALLFVLLPAVIGASPGKKVIGLRVVGDDGTEPSITQHLSRTVVGLVDLIPGFIPGLLGWVVASNDTLTRRLGDRVAHTSVVDAKKELRLVDEATWKRQREALENPLLMDTPTDLDSMIELNDRLGIPSEVPEVELPEIEIPAAEAEVPEAEADVSEAEAEVSEAEAEVSEIEVPETAVEHNTTPLPSRRQPETAWETPIGTPAPVWNPQQAVVDEEAALQAEHDLKQAEALPVEEAAPVQEAVESQAAVDPVWNAEWNAWLYWDATGERWLRHDQATNEWVQIS